MKYVLLLLTLIAMTYSSTDYTCTGDASNYLACRFKTKPDDCYCCYIKATYKLISGTIYQCTYIKKSLIDDNNIYTYIKAQESLVYSKVHTLYCKSSYLTVGFLSFLLFLF